MTRSLTIATAALLTVGTTACASAPARYPVDRRITVARASFTQVWDAAIDAVADRGWPLDEIDRASGVLVTDWLVGVDPAWYDCGSPGLFDHQYNQAGRVTVVVREADDGVSLAVNTAWRAVRKGSDVEDAPYDVPCESTGVLEPEFHDSVLDRVEGAPRP